MMFTADLTFPLSLSRPECGCIQRADSSSSSQDEVSILPKHTRVLVTGNNRTKRSLVGQEAVVKKAVGLGGWHWLVLSNGEEIKLQRNALSVLEIGPEDQNSDSENEKDTRDTTQIEILTQPRVRRPPKTLTLIPEICKKAGPMYPPSILAPLPAVNLHRLETQSLRRYRKAYQLANVAPEAHKEALVDAVYAHFRNLEVEEEQVLLAFASALRKRRAAATSC